MAPNQPPAKPERLIQVADPRLNPGTRDFAVTIRFKTSRTFGNMIQKGQANTPGGYFKWQIPLGKLACLFRGRAPDGTVLSKSVNSGDILLNDDQWHTVRCERTVDRVTMTIDGVRTRKALGPTGSISNTVPMTIAGKVNCDQATITCDYFVGEMDFIKIEVAPTGPPVVTPPTTPGQQVGVSNDYSSIDLTWPGSTDDVSSTVTYRVFRDGVWAATTTSSAPMVSYKDTGLVPDSTHVYGIVALDGAQNASPMSDPSEPITVQSVPPVLIVDDFSGGLSSWTATRVTLDSGDGSPVSAERARSGLRTVGVRHACPACVSRFGVRQRQREPDGVRGQQCCSVSEPRPMDRSHGWRSTPAPVSVSGPMFQASRLGPWRH